MKSKIGHAISKLDQFNDIQTERKEESFESEDLCNDASDKVQDQSSEMTSWDGIDSLTKSLIKKPFITIHPNLSNKSLGKVQWSA